jgi:hypothetical protein
MYQSGEYVTGPGEKPRDRLAMLSEWFDRLSDGIAWRSTDRFILDELGRDELVKTQLKS